MRLRTGLFLCFLMLSLIATAQRRESQRPSSTPEENALKEKMDDRIKSRWTAGFETFFPQRTSVSRVEISEEEVRVYFSDSLGWLPLREEHLSEMDSLVRPLLSEAMQDMPLRYYVGQTPLESLFPRAMPPADPLSVHSRKTLPLVRQENAPGPLPLAGLYGRHLMVSSSHGWMYDLEKSFRWEWQRARLFTTVEDTHSVSYIVPFLIPMLERAGAVVFHTRERDWQVHEVVLDDEDVRGRRIPGRVQRSGRWRLSQEPGFASGLAPYPDAFNPHQAGKVHTIATRLHASGRYEWIPDIPETGEYGVYVSYSAAPDRAPDARYTVHHLGGQTTFHVNQQMGGNTWVWLGRFKFAQGTNPRQGRVELSNQSAFSGTTVSADAVKFGGGMGDIIREGETSGYPRFLEGARYWLQYAGADPDLTYKMGFTTGYEGPDYTDDFSCRPEWANFLQGAPGGPNKDRNHPGLGIPIDLLFSLHTDAGISDGIVGTLSIYRTRDQIGQEVFPDGRSRLLNRELADLVQTQIVDDARALYTSSWSRRRLQDGDYAESRRGNVPSCLIELLSHQNFNDMKYGLDPRFRRDMARAFYKGMLRFMARELAFEPVVQPLPPTHLMVRQISADTVELRWKPQEDPLEPSARPDGYIIYRRDGQGGFNNGVYTDADHVTYGSLQPGIIYSFQVEAVNQGGRSLPSETLAVTLGDNHAPRALIVYGFDRIAPPSIIDTEGYQGFGGGDRGVGYHINIGRTGEQYDFDPESKFISNDAPGHGASAGDEESLLDLGNTFDYVARHGEAFRANGWVFDSASDKAVEQGWVDLKSYPLVNWVLGEQRTEKVPSGFIESGTADRMTPMFQTFTPGLQERVRQYSESGGALFVSGAYVGTDLAAGLPESATEDRKFLEEVLHVDWVTNHGSSTNELFVQTGDLFDGLENLRFAKGVGEDGVYGVELPDAIDPVKDSGGRTVLRYADRRFSAGVIHEATETGARTFVLGFPFETLIGEQNRSEFLARALQFLAPVE